MRSRWRPALLLPLGLAVGLVATACGSPSASTTYTKKLEAACAPYVSTSQPTAGDPLAQVRDVLANLDELLPRLARVPPTPDTRVRALRLLTEMQELKEIQSSVYRDLKNGVRRDYTALEARYERVAAQLHVTAKSLDAPSCSRAANPRD